MSRRRNRKRLGDSPVSLNWTDPRKTAPAAYRAGKRFAHWLFGTKESRALNVPGWVVLAGAAYVFRKPIARKWRKWTH